MRNKFFKRNLTTIMIMVLLTILCFGQALVTRADDSGNYTTDPRAYFGGGINETLDNGTLVYDKYSSEIDISKHIISCNAIEFSKDIEKFPALKKLVMCDCGYSNEDMEYLMEQHPDIKFVWRLYMGKWSCRTDAISFTTAQDKGFVITMNNEQAAQFKYCTDMVCLDIGHNSVTDLRFLKYMPELRIFIIHENFDRFNGGYIKDLSYLKYCPKLEYLEMFVSSVSDTSFMQYTPNLKDIYATQTPISDITYILGLTRLERLFIQATKISRDDYDRLVQAFPDAKILYNGFQSVHDNGWRVHPRFYAMRWTVRNNAVHELFADELDTSYVPMDVVAALHTPVVEEDESLSENSVSDNVVSENAVTENIVTENVVSNNQVSQNQVISESVETNE